MNKEKFRFYKDYPKTCSPTDFWGQVKRTVNGKPVSQDQIDMIDDAVATELQLDKNDSLLDLCCGNGALSTLFFRHCSSGLGVDFSEYLISIAKKNFSAPPDREFLCQDVVEFCEDPLTPHQFTKAVCYGSFSYLEKTAAVKLLGLLRKNFPNLKRVFIGNCPDKDLIDDFYVDKDYTEGIENEPDSPIGIWRTRQDFAMLAKSCGWTSYLHEMPRSYYASHYRFDIVLTNE